jgi:hypothetical protein
MDTITTSTPHGFQTGNTVLLTSGYTNKFVSWIKKIFETRVWYKVSEVTLTRFNLEFCDRETFWDRVKKKFKK